jgi:hypothetical protein
MDIGEVARMAGSYSASTRILRRFCCTGSGQHISLVLEIGAVF